MAAFLFFDRKLFEPYNHFIYPFLGFFIFALICSFFNPDIVLSISKWLSYLLIYIVIPNYVSKLYRDDARNFLSFFIYFVIFLLSVSVLLYFTNREMLSIEGRYRGIFGNPNALGLFCSIFYMVLLIIVDLEPNLFNVKQKRFFIAIIILNILMARSRTSFITLGMFTLFLAAFKHSSFWGFITVILAFTLNAFLIDFVQFAADTFGLQEYLRLKDLKKGSGRIIAWTFGWKIVNQETYFVGNGFNYTSYIYELYTEELNLLGHQGNAHNSYLTFWLDTGIIGLLMFISGFLKSFVKLSQKTRLAFPIMFCVGFTMFFESWFCASLNPYVFQILMVLTLASLPRLNELEPKAESEEFNEYGIENKLITV